MMTSDPAVRPPFCEVHGCRGRWAADLPHALCGKASATAADRLAATRLCPEHHQPVVDGRLTAAMAVVLGWHKSTVLHACEARFEMRREADGE